MIAHTGRTLPAVSAWVVLLIAAAAVALVDWWAVASGRRRVEYVVKPLTMALLVGVAATAGDPSGDVRAWLVAGAALGLVGDIALMGDGEIEFMVGLGAFALGHLAYAVAAVLIGFDPAWALVGAVFMAALLSFRFATRTVPGARRFGDRALAGAVIFYACVITAMVVTAWGTTAALAGFGAMAFAISDWVLGHERFVGPIPGGRLSVMVPYHVGQALLIVGLARA
jgi:uncharacterized membrane protein YhhN